MALNCNICFLKAWLIFFRSASLSNLKGGPRFFCTFSVSLIKQAKNATNENLNLTKEVRTTLMNYIKFQQHQLHKLIGKINRKSVLLEDLNWLKYWSRKWVETRRKGDEKRENIFLINYCGITWLTYYTRHKKICENYFVNARSGYVGHHFQ